MRPDPSRARAPRRGAAFAALDPGTRTRVDAIRILKRWTDTGDFPDRLFGEIPSARRGFAMDLVYATVRNVRALDFALRSFLAREPEHPHAAVALLLGAAQILKMPDVAEHAAVFSTVEALKALDGPQPCGFANGVLRNLLRNRGVALETLAGAPPAVRESHPDAQVARWTERFGAERAEAICKWDNEPASPVVLSLPHRPSPPELMASFLAAGVEAKRHPGVPERALVIPHGSHVDRLPGFAEGLFSIQDPATLEAVRLLDVRPGQRVLDACAAPGGKSVQIAALLEGTGGSLVSMDCWRDRLVPLRDNLRRFGFDGLARVVLGDAKRVRPADVGGEPFDRILADVPCSNTGVQRRRADARWRFDETRLATLVQVQEAILENLAGLLAPGGRLVYSTCSLEAEENDAVVAGFLERHPDWRLAGKSAQVPPDRSCDGAFAAALERAPDRG
ncbi:MAG: RsmB/NOP family class I SAM-dependent RNA methyltransferase [Kiritimatiellae bacterium]|nr:RsmB/NOP family class I SAM-dependent RNA methyltransferase [Kiritimatiellia bacterium]